MVHTLRSLTSTDKSVSETTLYSIRRAAQINLNKNDLPSTTEALHWINIGDRENGFRSWWTKVRNNISYLSKVLNLTFRFSENEHGICLTVSGSDAHITFHPKNRDEICHKLHSISQAQHYIMWCEQIRAGISAKALARDNSTSRVLHNGSVSIAEWFFIHSAGTNMLPVNARPQNKNEKRCCRKCQYNSETQYHVFCTCPANMSLIRFRHNSILDIIYDAIKLTNTDRKILKDKRCEISQTQLRVDLHVVLQSRFSKQIHLINIKTPYDTTESFKRVNEENIKKYSDLKKEILDLMSGWNVLLDTVIVGCFGSWIKRNDRVLKT